MEGEVTNPPNQYRKESMKKKSKTQIREEMVLELMWILVHRKCKKIPKMPKR